MLFTLVLLTEPFSEGLAAGSRLIPGLGGGNVFLVCRGDLDASLFFLSVGLPLLFCGVLLAADELDSDVEGLGTGETASLKMNKSEKN